MHKSRLEISTTIFALTWILFMIKATILFETDDSQKCREDCIDKNFYFCTTPDGHSGACCKDRDKCKLKYEDNCSYDSSYDNKAFEYWLCP